MRLHIENLAGSDELLTLAWKAATSAGSFLQNQRPSSLTVSSKSTATDAVTEMDRGAEDLIISTLLAARPDDGVLGEEGGERVGSSDVRWIVDPLDGTVNYIYDLPVWGVSIAAERAGRIHAGVVVAPALGQSWCAVRGGGAWEVDGRGAVRITPSSVASLASALVATGFSYDAERRRRQGAVIAGLLPDVRDVRRVGAAVVDLCWVASGRYDAFMERGLHPWDYAAGALIAEEAGAQVTAMSGADLATGVIAAAPGISEALCTRLRELGADRV